MAYTTDIKVGLTKDQKKKIQKKAEALGIPPATYLRMAGLYVNLKLSPENPNKIIDKTRY